MGGSMEEKIFCSCKSLVIAKRDDVIKIRGKIFLFKDGYGYAVCHGCGDEIKVIDLKGKSIDINNDTNILEIIK